MPTRQAGVYFLLAGIICAVTAVYGFLSFSIVIAAATAIVAVKSQTGKRRISALFLIGAAFGTISSVWQECHRQSVPYPAIYGEFTVDIGAFVRGGVNLVEVTVDNSLVPNCRWYSGSGIYRPVSLIVEGEKAPSEPQVHTISIDPAIVRVTADDDAQIKLGEDYI